MEVVMGHDRLGDFGHDARHSGKRWESTGKLVRWACGMVRHMEGRCSDLEPVNADYTCADKVSPCRMGMFFAVIDWGLVFVIRVE